jgi:amino acid permease
VVIPLSFLRRLDSLKYTSVIALLSIGYLIVLVVYHFAKGDTMADRGEIRYVEWGGAIATLSSFPVIVFAYTCHQNVGGSNAGIILSYYTDSNHLRCFLF